MYLKRILSPMWWMVSICNHTGNIYGKYGLTKVYVEFFSAVITFRLADLYLVNMFYYCFSSSVDGKYQKTSSVIRHNNVHRRKPFSYSAELIGMVLMVDNNKFP